MTVDGTVARVVLRLEDAGYESLGSQVHVGTIPYEFDAVLVGPPETLDLIIVVNTETESTTRLRQKVDGLGRALDMARSRRAVTTILVGPALGTATWTGNWAGVAVTAARPASKERMILLMVWRSLTEPLPRRPGASPQDSAPTDASSDRRGKTGRSTRRVRAWGI